MEAANEVKTNPNYDEVSRVAQKYGDLLTDRLVKGFARTVFFGQKNVYKVSDKKEDISGATTKEGRVLDLVQSRIKTEVRKMIPEPVANEVLSDGRLIDVQTIVPGVSLQKLSAENWRELGIFLASLHQIGPFEEMTEFESTESLGRFEVYMCDRVQKFRSKLTGRVSDVDQALVERVTEKVLSTPTDIWYSSPLVLIHKDTYLPNLLVEKGCLSGVIDWDASQTGPVEWELAIIKQRYPEAFNIVYDCCESDFSQELFVACGLVQSLRFWKSFPDQEDFVDQQRSFIMELLG